MGVKNFAWFRKQVNETKAKGEVAFVQYMKCSRSRDNVEKELTCISMQCSTDEDINYTLQERCFGSAERSLSAGSGLEPRHFFQSKAQFT